MHPQSIVHSLVRFADGAVLAHLGVPDMRTPIGYALELPRARARCRWCGRSTCSRADAHVRRARHSRRFAACALAREAGETARGLGRSRPGDGGGGAGAAAPIVLNAANEVAVAAFLDRRIGFLGIAEVVEASLERLRRRTSAPRSTTSSRCDARGARGGADERRRRPALTRASAATTRCVLPRASRYSCGRRESIGRKPGR